VEEPSGRFSCRETSSAKSESKVFTPPGYRAPLGARTEEINGEHQSAPGKPVPSPCRAIRPRRRAGQESPSTNPHSRYSFLPTLDQTGQRKLNGLSTTPRRVELLAGLKINSYVVDLDNGAGQRFITLPHNNICDHHFGGFRSHLGFNLGLGGVHALFLSWGCRDCLRSLMLRAGVP